MSEFDKIFKVTFAEVLRPAWFSDAGVATRAARPWPT